MTWSIRKTVIFCLWVGVILFVVTPIQGQESKENKVKLTGAELKELLGKSGAISFGINHSNNSVFIIEVLESGNRSIYWRSLGNPLVWGTDMGTAEINGEQLCSKWRFGPRNCFDVYRVGENKYESYLDGSLLVTFYKGQRDYEPKKDKVKLTEAELKRGESQYAVYAGINQRKQFVWIIVRPSGGKRELYWRSLVMPGLSASWTGTAEIVEDQSCTKWTFGPKRCYEYYKVGEDKYESWIAGSIDSVYYQLK